MTPDRFAKCQTRSSSSCVGKSERTTTKTKARNREYNFYHFISVCVYGHWRRDAIYGKITGGARREEFWEACNKFLLGATSYIVLIYVRYVDCCFGWCYVPIQHRKRYNRRSRRCRCSAAKQNVTLHRAGKSIIRQRIRINFAHDGGTS